MTREKRHRHQRASEVKGFSGRLGRIASTARFKVTDSIVVALDPAATIDGFETIAANFGLRSWYAGDRLALFICHFGRKA